MIMMVIMIMRYIQYIKEKAEMTAHELYCVITNGDEQDELSICFYCLYLCENGVYAATEQHIQLILARFAIAAIIHGKFSSSKSS